MGITTNTRNTFQPKVEQGDIETGFLEEWHNEASQAAVDMHPNVMFKCDFGECGDVVHATIREINSRADELEDNQIKRSQIIEYLCTIIVFGLLSKLFRK